MMVRGGVGETLVERFMISQSDFYGSDEKHNHITAKEKMV
jgi:hypothetical protein